MLPHYSPFKVAETFSVLAGLYPGRIDLGLGRAAGTDPMTTHALQRDRGRALPDDFPQQLAELLAYFEGAIPLSSPLARLAKILPGRPEVPEPWLLGSSPQSAVWAGELGLPYAFADFINPRGAEIAELYRREFRAGVRLDAPRTVVAVWAVAAESEEEAVRLAASSRMAFTMLRRGRLIPVPPPDTAVRFLETEGDGAVEPAARDRRHRRAGARGDRGGRRRVRRGGGDRGHDHLRPRRPPALLRADRLRVRATGVRARSSRRRTARSFRSPTRGCRRRRARRRPPRSRGRRCAARR